MIKNFYAVKMGRKIGIFHTWEETEGYVKGYSGALYKGFKRRDEAEAWLKADDPHWAPKTKHTRRKAKCQRLLKPARTNPVGLTEFYDGETPPWEFDFHIHCSEEVRYQKWLYIHAFKEHDNV